MLKPYHNKNNVTIYHGGALEVLKQMDKESVDMVMTSPPYWGLRDYGHEGHIWDSVDSCVHEWRTERTSRPNSSGGKTEYAKNILARKGKENSSEFTEYNDRATYTDFCLKCNAWRGSLGLEPTYQLYINHLIHIFNEVKRVLKDTGSCWVNLGDTYSGMKVGNIENIKNPNVETDSFIKPKQNIKDKSLIGIPERFAIAMTDAGWIRRNTIIWYKPNCMPSSANDRFTVDFEYLYFFTKNPQYYFEQQFEKVQGSTIKRNEYPHSGGGPYSMGRERRPGEFMQEQGRNKRCVWQLPTKPYPDAHFATYPEKLCETPIKAGCPKGGTVMDIFAGSFTTLKVARELGRKGIGIELNEDYIKMGIKRMKLNQALLFN